MTENTLQMSDLILALGRSSTFGPPGRVKRVATNEISRISPTEGRVLRTIDQGREVYYANGSEWLLVDDNVGFRTPSLSTGDLESETALIERGSIGNINVTQGRWGQVSRISGDEVDVEPDDYHEIFDLQEAVDLIDVSVSGPIITQWRVTWDDGSTSTTGGRATGRTADNDEAITTKILTNISGVTRLEFRHDAGTQQTFGYEARFIDAAGTEVE